MKRFIRSKKGLALLATLVVVLASAIGAYAYFSNTGTGTNATAATVGPAPAKTLLVTVGTTAGGDLVPTVWNDTNGVQDDIPVTVANQDEQDEGFNTIKLTVNGTSAAGCSAANFSINNDGTSATVTVGDQTLAPLSDSGSYTTPAHTFELQMIETGAPQDACQGATVSLTAVASQV